MNHFWAWNLDVIGGALNNRAKEREGRLLHNGLNNVLGIGSRFSIIMLKRWISLTQHSFQTVREPYPHLLAAITPINKLPSAVLTPTSSIIRTLDASRTKSSAVSGTIPEERPRINILCESRGNGASVSRASSIRSTVARVVFVVGDEDGESLGL